MQENALSDAFSTSPPAEGQPGDSLSPHFRRAEQPVSLVLRWALPVATAGYAAGVFLGSRIAISWALWMGLAVAVVTLFLLAKKGRLLGIGLVALALGTLLGHGAANAPLPAEGEVQVTGAISAEIRNRNNRISTRLTHVALDGMPTGDAYWSYYLNKDTRGYDLSPGQQVTFTARVYHPNRAMNPDGFDFRLYLRGQGITYGIYGAKELVHQGNQLTLRTLPGVIRHQVASKFRQVLGKTAGDYATALVLGNRDGIPQEEREAFRKLGVAHLLAVSGFHVGVLAAGVSFLLQLFKAGRKARLLVLTILLAAYVWLTGGSPSVVRAAVMLAMGELSRLLHRPRCDVHVICASFLVTILLQPAQLLSASLHLTYAAVVGILVTAPMRHRVSASLQNRLREPQQRFGAWLVHRLRLEQHPKGGKWCLYILPRTVCGFLAGVVSSALVTLGAMLGTVLPQLYWFHSLPVFSFVTNLLLVPLFTVLIAACWMMGLLMWLPVVGTWAGTVVAAYGEGLLSLLRALSEHGGLEWWLRKSSFLTVVGWALLLVFATGFLLTRWRTRLALTSAGAALIVLSMLPPLPCRPTYLQMAVGNADAAVIQSQGEVTVIDTGVTGQELASYLHQYHLPIDRLIITHLHTDHAGGIRGLLDQGIPVKECYISDAARIAAIDDGMDALLLELAQTGTAFYEVARGDFIPLKGGQLQVLWPVRGMTRPGQDANASSLVMHLTIRGTTMLLTGDMDGVYELYAAPRVHLLKVAHHGSGASTGTAYRQLVSPQALLLSGEDAKRYALTRERFPNLPLYQTGRHGATLVTFQDGGYHITSLLDLSPMEALDATEP